VFVIAFAVLAGGCGGDDSQSKMERAIEAGEVTGVDADARSAECDDGLPLAVRDRTGRMYACTADTPAGTIHLTCSDVAGEENLACVDTGAPPGTPVFTTAAERAAPKEVTWKCEDENEQGQAIGPVLVAIKGAPSGGPVEEHEWMTETQARELARQLKAQFGTDC
jgi:hypothetical protein